MALTWALGATSADAQTPYLTATERSQLELELGELEPRISESWQALAAAQREAERLERLRDRRVFRTVGSIQFRTDPELAGLVEAAVGGALAEFGGLLAEFELRAPLKLDVYHQERLRPRPGGLDGEEDWTGVRLMPDYVTGDIRRAVTPWVLEAIPGPIGAWSGGRGWALSYEPRVGSRELARSRDPDGLACLQLGDLAACSRYFFLEYDGTLKSREAGLERVYPADPRHATGIDPARAQYGASLFGCAETRADQGSEDPRAECLASLAQREGVALELFPGGAAARSSLLAHAVRLSRPGGFRRLASLPEGSPVGAQLEALAEMPLDELLASWRSDVSLGRGLFSANRRDRPGPASLFWAGGCAMLALRSTRWRLG